MDLTEAFGQELLSGILKEQPKKSPLLLKHLKIRTKERGLMTLKVNSSQFRFLKTLYLESQKKAPNQKLYDPIINTNWPELGLIIDKESGEYVTEQREFFSFEQNQLPPLRGVRYIVLKARQMGFTTVTQGTFFQDTLNVPNTQTILIAQDEQNSKRIFQIVKRFYENLPPHIKDLYPLGTDSKTELYFPTIDSYIYVGWAGSKKIGRGGTINNLHGSEVAFWEDAKEIVAGLMESVPNGGNVVLESTAKGVGNFFHSEWISAKNGESDFKPFFAGWNEHYEYQVPLSDEDKVELEFSLSEEETRLRNTYSLSLEQIAWRKKKIRTLREDFPQEYPINDVEAFKTSGNPYFDREALAEITQVASKSLGDILIPKKFEALNIAKNKLEIYKMPVKGHRYIIAADPSEGLALNGQSDFCSCDVVDADTNEQVAHLHGKWEPAHFATLINDLSRWYGNALVAIESNNHGYTVLAVLQRDYGWEKPKYGEWEGLYHFIDPTAKKIYYKQGTKPGFPTTRKTKYAALNHLSSFILDRSFGINSQKTLAELNSFIHMPGGRAGAEGLAHDDCVMSLAISSYILSNRPVESAKKRAKMMVGETRRGTSYV